MKIVPTWVWWILILIAGVSGYLYGKDKVQDKWDISIVRGKQLLKEKENQRTIPSIIIQDRIVYRDKIIHEKAKIIEKVREVFVPTDSGMLSGGFRLFYDAAINNTIPDTTKIADATPVSIADVADTHAYNAEQCNKAYLRVEGWQDWANKQCKLNDKGCVDGGQ